MQQGAVGGTSGDSGREEAWAGLLRRQGWPWGWQHCGCSHCLSPVPRGTTQSHCLSHSTLPACGAALPWCWWELGGDAARGWNTGCHQVSLVGYQHMTASPCPSVAVSLAHLETPLWCFGMCTGQPEPWGLQRKVRAEPWPWPERNRQWQCWTPLSCQWAWTPQQLCHGQGTGQPGCPTAPLRAGASLVAGQKGRVPAGGKQAVRPWPVQNQTGYRRKAASPSLQGAGCSMGCSWDHNRRKPNCF